MSEINQKIIKMIENNATANEISQATGLSNKQLFYRLHILKTKGYEFLRKYYYDGEIGYELCKNLNEKKDVCLLTKPTDKKIKIVFISDLHLSNTMDRIDLLNQVYEFCTKNGIHIIINAGDIIDGFTGSVNHKRFETAEEQIKYLLKNYPFDKNIINFACLGNHDYSILETSGQNLENILSAQRHDIVSLGYGNGKLKIKNDEILVTHKISSIPVETIKHGLIIAGHWHKTRNTSCADVVRIQLPPLSDLSNPLPGFISAIIFFKPNGTFQCVNFEQYIFLDKMYKVNDSFYTLNTKKKIEKETIQNEEIRIPYEEKIKIKTLDNDNS